MKSALIASSWIVGVIFLLLAGYVLGGGGPMFDYTLMAASGVILLVVATGNLYDKGYKRGLGFVVQEKNDGDVQTAHKPLRTGDVYRTLGVVTAGSRLVVVLRHEESAAIVAYLFAETPPERFVVVDASSAPRYVPVPAEQAE